MRSVGRSGAIRDIRQRTELVAQVSRGADAGTARNAAQSTPDQVDPASARRRALHVTDFNGWCCGGAGLNPEGSVGRGAEATSPLPLDSFMRERWIRWWQDNRVILANSGSLVGTTVATSVLGFMFWWVAARYFSPEAVGLASAAVSAMSLLAGIAVFGLGTLLLTELPRQPDVVGPLSSASRLAACGMRSRAGRMFRTGIAPTISPHLAAFWSPRGATALFVRAWPA